MSKLPTFEEQFEKLSQKYRGLRKEDLEEMNPEYSCVICKKFKKCGDTGNACPDAIKMSEDEFALTYNFEV